jgi:MFS transporter, DHA3 family, macrolide efflux protein
VLRLRTFYTLVVTQALSAFGSQVSTFAVSIWVFNETGRATPLALVSFFFGIAYLIGGGLAGVMADRFDRRYLLLAADGGAALATCALLASFLSGGFELWHLYAVAFSQALFTAFQVPAFQASVTLLVPDAHRDRANAIQQIAYPAAGILGPAVGGLLYASIGVVGAIMIDLATFAAAGVVLALIRLPRPAGTEAGRALGQGLWNQVFGGFRYLLQHRRLLAVCAFFSATNLLFITCWVLMTPYALARLRDESQLGLVLGAFSLGAVAGGLVMSAWGGTRPRIHAIMLCIAAEGVFLALCGTAQAFWVLAGGLLLLGALPPVANASFLSIFQAKVAPDVQGRVFAAIVQLAAGTQPLAALVAGPLADRVFEPARGLDGWRWVAPIVGGDSGAGMGLMFVIAGALTTLLSLAVYAAPAIRGMEAAMPDHDAGLSPAGSTP